VAFDLDYLLCVVELSSCDQERCYTIWRSTAMLDLEFLSFGHRFLVTIVIYFSLQNFIKSVDISLE